MAIKGSVEYVDVIRGVILALFIIASIAGALSIKLGYTHVDEYHVYKVEKILNLSHEYNGFGMDDVKYYVHTDKGMFLIEMSGLNAYAYGLSIIRADNNYRLKTRGARIEMWGLYPNIIDVIEEDL